MAARTKISSEYMTGEQLDAALCISKATRLRWLEADKIPGPALRIGKRALWDKSVIDLFLADERAKQERNGNGWKPTIITELPAEQKQAA